MNIPKRGRKGIHGEEPVPTLERRQGVSAGLGRTYALLETPLRLDWSRLDPSEQWRLCDLAEGCWGGDRLDLSRLAKSERRDLERLVERAAGIAGGYFDSLRDTERIAALAAEERAQAARRPFPRKAEPGLLAEIAAQLQKGVLRADGVAALMVILAQFQTGVALAPRGYFAEFDGESWLVVNPQYGFAGATDPRGTLAAWQKQVEHLHRNGWIVLDARGGSEWRIKLGPRTLRLIEPAKARAAA